MRLLIVVWCCCLLLCVASRCSLCVVNRCRLLFAVCRWCCLPLAIADCCMSCIDCCVVVNCGRARRCLMLFVVLFCLRAVDVVYKVLFCSVLFRCFVDAVAEVLLVVCCCLLLRLCAGVRRCLLRVVCILLLAVRC